MYRKKGTDTFISAIVWDGTLPRANEILQFGYEYGRSYQFDLVDRKITIQDHHGDINLGDAITPDGIISHKCFIRSYTPVYTVCSEVYGNLGDHLTLSAESVIMPDSVVGDDLYIANQGHVMHRTVIGDNAYFGWDTEIFPDCTIGENAYFSGGCVIHKGATLGKGAKIDMSCTLHRPHILRGATWIS